MTQDLIGRISISFPNKSEWFTGRLVKPTGSSQQFSLCGFDTRTERFDFGSNKQMNWDRLNEVNNNHQNISESDYKVLVQKAISACKGSIEKVVLSRSFDIEVDTIDIENWLDRLRTEFPNALVYCLQTKFHGCWIGATPEVLVKKTGDNLETMSLAGTKWGDEPFSEKEYIEQGVVTESILSDLDLSTKVAGSPKIVEFGNIRHLQTNIAWKSNDSLAEVSEMLHPTPAICGFPKADAKQFILSNEGYNRELYTGYLQFEGFSEIDYSFVNLRCMQLFRDRVRIYVGGGINALSDPETEWIETEKKLGAITKALKIEY